MIHSTLRALKVPFDKLRVPFVKVTQFGRFRVYQGFTELVEVNLIGSFGFRGIEIMKDIVTFT